MIILSGDFYPVNKKQIEISEIKIFVLKVS